MNSVTTSLRPAVDEVMERVERLMTVDRPRYRRLWAYCRNPMRTSIVIDESGSEKPYVQAQEWGLPSRITGIKSGGDVFEGELIDGVARKEVVIENDIGWRVDTMVDYLFGKSIVIESRAKDPARKEQIGELLRLILGHNGGILFLQQLALLGSVYGFVDVLVKLADGGEEVAGVCGTAALGQPPAATGSGEGRTGSESASADGEAASPEGEVSAPVAEEASHIDEQSQTRDARNFSPEALERLARLVRLEIIEPARALPFLCSEDWKRVHAYGQCWEVRGDGPEFRVQGSGRNGLWGRARKGVARWLGRNGVPVRSGGEEKSVMVELIAGDRWWRLRDGQVVAEGENSLGRIPLVHVQNTAVPFEYSGAGDVEPLLPLQDELNIRLSDRASRITLQSFKMYLGKGIEGFTRLPVAPGRMWATENEQADVIEFGGDANCPSEDAHISDMREAMDKTSGVTPIAAGAIKGRIGHLTSAAALRITLQALLSKTEKKRTTYGAAIEQMCELALAWLDRAGVFKTEPAERRVEIHWPSPLPENLMDRLDEAEAKLRVGVSQDVVLRELGY
ncbi:MAG TPA: phage portal protein [Tepidisphaeraceae bacterium]|jgi:hypothetical protein